MSFSELSDKITLIRSQATTPETSSLSDTSTVIDSDVNFKSDIRSVPCGEDLPPDGGLQAWLVLLGSFLNLFSTFGIVNSYGVFQQHYTTTLLPNSSASIISLIGSLQLALLYGMSPLIGRIFDAYGGSILLPLGSFVTVLSLIMLSFCKANNAYQFFLCQGIFFGLGNALVFPPALAVVGHWFKRRRAYAIGIAASGSALGGVIYPIMLQELIPKIGFSWAVRVTALITLACLCVSCLTMRTRLPLSRRMSFRDCMDFEGFKDWRYALSALGAFLAFYALFIPYFYIEQYALFEGVSPELAKYLLPIINAMGIPSRILPGLFADKIGPLNVLTPSMVISGLFVLILWLLSRGAVAVTMFASLYGLFSGAFVSLLPSYIATITPVEKFGARLGSIYLVVAVANLVGTPTAGAFIRTVNQHDFNSLIVFTGVLVLSGSLAFGCVRTIHSPHLRARV
ncbi:monocarboxylate permease [Cristinia sonorae]|uniref:Monocarboxylate permease n=1 Tax=Cristinia sonorae TaxID=1940300 RepID=A0A8K0USY9_9AGAR|nr:monocarboxylate permease [Cristinia sonorae]